MLNIERFNGKPAKLAEYIQGHYDVWKVERDKASSGGIAAKTGPDGKTISQLLKERSVARSKAAMAKTRQAIEVSSAAKKARTTATLRRRKSG